MMGVGGTTVCCEASWAASFLHSGIARAVMGVLSAELSELLSRLVLTFSSLNKTISYSVSYEVSLMPNQAKEDAFCH